MATRRRPLVVANWKMHKTLAETRAYFFELARHLSAGSSASDAAEPIDVVVCPTFVAVATAAAARDEAFAAFPPPVRPRIGAQNAHGSPHGAFTGEVSAGQAKDAGAEYAIVGHSERRREFGETDALVAERLRGALRAGLIPALCVGETIEQRRAGETNAVIDHQLRSALAGLAAPDAGRIAVAYEPVWAIGSGLAASPADAREAAAYLRQVIAGLHGAGAGEVTRVLYGGSVGAENAGAFLAQPDVDGVLVGGASLDPAAFARIAAAARIARAAGRNGDG